jgi:ferredoxin-NADP reductase
MPFSSNRRPEDAPFVEELQAVQGRNPHYTFVGTMTEPQESARPWQGETGLLTAAVLSKYLVKVLGPKYQVVGPPGMVTAFRAIPKDTGIAAQDILTEQFTGY